MSDFSKVADRKGTTVDQVTIQMVITDKGEDGMEYVIVAGAPILDQDGAVMDKVNGVDLKPRMSPHVKAAQKEFMDRALALFRMKVGGPDPDA